MTPFSAYDDVRKRRVMVYSEGRELNFSEEVSPGVYRWRLTQRGHIRLDKAIVTVERRCLDNGWSTWTEVHRLPDSRPSPRKILPAMTEQERSAWAAYALPYVNRGVGLRELAQKLPGWDDIETFDPRRMPYDGDYLWPSASDSTDAWAPFGGYILAHDRAMALAGMALRRLVRDGVAHKVDGESRWIFA